MAAQTISIRAALTFGRQALHTSVFLMGHSIPFVTFGFFIMVDFREWLSGGFLLEDLFCFNYEFTRLANRVKDL